MDGLFCQQQLVHVRFAPNGTVTEIAARPEGMSAQDWFNLLSRTFGDSYQAFAGGRGVFRVSQTELAELSGRAAAG